MFIYVCSITNVDSCYRFIFFLFMYFYLSFHFFLFIYTLYNIFKNKKPWIKQSDS